VRRKTKGVSSRNESSLLVWRRDFETSALRLCSRQIRGPELRPPKTAEADFPIDQFASAAICLSKSDNVRRISSLKRSLVLCSNCCTTRLRDSSKSAFLIRDCACSALTAGLVLVVLAERDSSIWASTDLLSQPRAMP
jgi:hypothetical protein